MIPVLVDGMGGGRRKDGSISQEVCLKKEEITKALRNFSRIIAWIITNRLDRELRKLDPHSKTLWFHPKTVVFMPRLAAALIARGRPTDKFVKSRCKACRLDPTKTIVLDITVLEARAIARDFLTEERTRHLGWKILCEIRAYTLEQHPVFDEPDTIAKLVIFPEEALEIITRMGKRGTPRVTTYRLRKRIKRLNKRAELPGSFSTSNPPKEKSPFRKRGILFRTTRPQAIRKGPNRHFVQELSQLP